ncbi:tRNA pseudouridine(38-40) synthase TruA [Paraliomyxa miuraensis]|uniref:tRNA pseudouridine(38-40) synthase TruA n=1 Tax=Paraliomyxa miuraensis TaxID=376150 RepID=UPI002259D744|nr:tRNA pseudouridine(38-40) synthase TruA [Paraliomyxa miuraensis]MCX4241372.1 tRNA pseudouridine(38-40) synthase TruA [Paraliomyxa miuraensis]
MSTLLRVAYDGSAFHGFARQAAGPGGPIRTVQGELETALAGLYGAPVPTRGASRTDAGVHARGQLVAFEGPRAIPPRGVARALNGRLPPDVAVLAAWEEHGHDGAPVDVRRGNAGKHYRYRIRCTDARDPLAVHGEWSLRRRLDPSVMQAAARALEGTHDFGSFRSAHCQATSTERTIDRVTLRWGADPRGPLGDPGRLDAVADGGAPGHGPDVIEVDVHGSAFLYNMVRIMVGTLVEVGLGRRPVDSIAQLLSIPDRTRAGPTAPACGLTLMEVRWPGTAGAGPQW